MPDDTGDERQLILALREGDVGAYAIIYHRYFRPLFIYSLQFTKSRNDAEDIVHDVFTKLWVKRESIRSTDSIKALLFTIARNDLISSFRRMMSSPLFDDYMDHANSLGREDHDIIEYREFEESVMRIIRSLPPSQHRVFTMSRFDHMTNSEIALKLGINEQSVKNNLHLATKFIRSKLKDILHLVTLLVMLN